MADLGAKALAVETSLVWGDVPRECEAELYSVVTPSLVVSTFADVGTLVRGINLVVASTFTWFLSVLMPPSVEI